MYILSRVYMHESGLIDQHAYAEYPDLLSAQDSVKNVQWMRFNPGNGEAIWWEGTNPKFKNSYWLLEEVKEKVMDFNVAEAQKKVKRLREALDSLEKQIEEASAPQDCYENGTVIRFTQYKRYTYAAIKANSRWYVTGYGNTSTCYTWNQIMKMCDGKFDVAATWLLSTKKGALND